MAKDFEDVLKDIGKKYTRPNEEEKFFKTGSIIFDEVISKGQGIPQRKFIQISSESGVGKTTMVLHFCKIACKNGGRCVYLDVEKGLVRNESIIEGTGLAEFRGKSFFDYPISTFEEAEEILDKILDDDKIVYIVIDSITALIPEKSIENSVGQVEPGLQARYSSAFLNKYKAKLERSAGHMSFIFINQMRTKINMRGMTTVGAAGGKAQEFFCDIRFLLKKKTKLERTVKTIEGKKTIPFGYEATLWAEKNRYNKPFVEGTIAIIFGKGISNIMAYKMVLMNKKVLTMAGAGFYTLALPGQEEKKGRGDAGASKLIKDNIKEIKAYVEENGGFDLVEEEEDAFA